MMVDGILSRLLCYDIYIKLMCVGSQIKRKCIKFRYLCTFVYTVIFSVCTCLFVCMSVFAWFEGESKTCKFNVQFCSFVVKKGNRCCQFFDKSPDLTDLKQNTQPFQS